MKVLLFSSLARDAGAWQRARYLARALARSSLVDVELVPAPSRSLPLLFDVPWSFPRYLWRALTSDADVLVAIKPFPNVTVPLLLAKWTRRRCVVVDVDDLDDAYFGGWRGSVVRLLQRPLPRWFDLVTHHHQELAAVLTGAFGVRTERIVRLEQGVDLEVFHPREGPIEKGTLAYAAHLNVASELPFLLRAVAALQREREAPLVVIGGGPCEAEHRALAAELGVEARFTGLVTPEVVADELARAEVCLAYHGSSRVNRYRCSMKLREYLAMGKKVVANRFGEFADFADVVYGGGDDAASYSAGIARALDRGDGREDRGPSLIAARYDWDVIAARFAERLLSRPATPCSPPRDP